MTRAIKRYITCENCSRTFDSEIYVSVTSDLENVVERVRSGEFMTFRCPHCGHIFFLSHPFSYNDSENNFIIQFVDESDDAFEFIREANNAKACFPNIFNKQKYRLISGPYSLLVEKLEIFKSGLNDKIIEFYKYYLSSALENKNYLAIEFEASKDYSQYRFNVIYEQNKIEHYGFSRDFYKEIEEKLIDAPFIHRNDDYIVDRRFVDSIVKQGDYAEPVHIDLYLTKKQHCVKVKLDNKTLWYKSEYNIGLNTKVEVPFSKYKLIGYVIEERDISEKELGFSFDKLRKVNKVYYSINDICNILNNGVLEELFSGAAIYNADLDLTPQELNMFVEGETIYYDSYMFAAQKLSKLEKNTRVAVVSSNPDCMEAFASASEYTFNVAVFTNQYFKVVKIYEHNGKNFILLLHLPKAYWHVLSANIELRIKSNNIIDLATERLNTKSFVDGQILTNDSQWASLCEWYNLAKEYSKICVSPVEIL